MNLSLFALEQLAVNLQTTLDFLFPALNTNVSTLQKPSLFPTPPPITPLYVDIAR